MMSNSTYIAADIGGTSARIGLFEGKDPDNLINKTEFKVQNDYLADLNNLLATIIDLSNNNRIDALSLGIPGSLDANKQMLLSSAHLSDWVRKPLAADLAQACSAPVTLINDADSGA